MLDFYVLDLKAIIIIAFLTLIIYKIIEFFDKENAYNKWLLITTALISSITISIFISYYTIEEDKLLTTNYWD